MLNKNEARMVHEIERNQFWEAAVTSALTGGMQFGPKAAAEHAVIAADALMAEWDKRNPEKPEEQEDPAPETAHRDAAGEVHTSGSTFRSGKQRRQP